MIIGNKKFENSTFVMAIVNLTPDSFFSDSRAMGDKALFAVERAVNEGADIVDIGAQSTRPGYIEVPATEEIERFAKPLRMIKERFDIPVSVDTYFARSAEAALQLGADMINDIWGLSRDDEMAKVIAKYNASVCIMHNDKSPLSGDIMVQITDFLTAMTVKAVNFGIDKDKICIDGGIGFALNREQNFTLLNNYEQLHTVGFPLLLGCSRKSMFGGNVDDRLKPTLEATKLAVKKGVLFVRVHDVKENIATIREML